MSGLLGPASSIPHIAATGSRSTSTDPQMRGGGAEPSELRLAIMRAHRAWAKKFCPWTLEEWLA
jgi:hypothetical protein